MDDHKIICLECGDIFQGDGNIIFCSVTCKDKYDEYWSYNEVDKK